MHFDDLSTLRDEDLCELEGRRTLEPADWRRIDDELRRRRRSRVPGLADLPGGPPPLAMPSLGDLERVTEALMFRLGATEREVRRLRWWVVLTPVVWVALAAATVLVAQALGLDLLQGVGLP